MVIVAFVYANFWLFTKYCTYVHKLLLISGLVLEKPSLQYIENTTMLSYSYM